MLACRCGQCERVRERKQATLAKQKEEGIFQFVCVLTKVLEFVQSIVGRPTDDGRERIVSNCASVCVLCSPKMNRFQ